MRDIVDDYDVFLLDMYGVLHNGTSLYDGALEAVQRLAAAAAGNKRLVVLSNSYRRSSECAAQLQALGLHNNSDNTELLSLTGIVTSGEVAAQTVLAATTTPSPTGRLCNSS